MPKIIIGILTHNGSKTLPWNLDNSLFWNQVKQWNVAVLALNQGSTDGTRAYLDGIKHNEFKVVHSPFNRSIVDGRQRLVDLVTLAADPDDVLVLLDHDTKATKFDWLEKLIAPMKNDPLVGICGSYVPSDIGVDEHDHWYLASPERVPEECDVVSACVTAYRMEMFHRGVGFDPIFAPMWHEDADLCLQARTLGYKVWGVKDIGMEHEVGHKLHDLVSVRNMHFMRRKWQGKGLIKAEKE